MEEVPEGPFTHLTRSGPPPCPGSQDICPPTHRLGQVGGATSPSLSPQALDGHHVKQRPLTLPAHSCSVVDGVHRASVACGHARRRGTNVEKLKGVCGN